MILKITYEEKTLDRCKVSFTHVVTAKRQKYHELTITRGTLLWCKMKNGKLMNLPDERLRIKGFTNGVQVIYLTHRPLSFTPWCILAVLQSRANTWPCAHCRKYTHTFNRKNKDREPLDRGFTVPHSRLQTVEYFILSYTPSKIHRVSLNILRWPLHLNLVDGCVL